MSAKQEDSKAAHEAYRMQLPAPAPVPAAKKQDTTKLMVVSPSKGFAYDPLNLANIRDTLMRLEESIIFALIERAQFKLNARIYNADTLAIAPNTSVLSYFLLESEKLGAQVRRFTSPSEHPFSDPALLPKPLLPELDYPVTVRPNGINHNAQVMHFYLATVLPSICDEGDDENYGSSAMADVAALQLLSKRIHYGKFVAESKFLSERAKFSAAIRARDIEALKSFITKPVVEEQVLERVRNKAAAYGRPPLPSASPSPQLGPIALAEGVAELALGPAAVPPASAAAAAAPFPASAAAAAVGTGGMVSSESHAPPPESDYKVAPEIIAQLYETIMTLNKDVQIAYLLQRLDE